MRRSQAMLTALAFGAAAFAAPARVKSDVAGSIAVQPTVPVRLTTCTAVTDGARFTPDVAFAPGSPAVSSWIVRMTFFDVTNLSTGFVDVRTRATFAVPAHSASMTCAIVREELADGTIFASGTVPADARGGAGGLASIALLAGQGALATATATPKPGTHPSVRPCVTPSAAPETPSASPATPSQSTTPSATPSSQPKRDERCR